METCKKKLGCLRQAGLCPRILFWERDIDELDREKSSQNTIKNNYSTIIEIYCEKLDKHYIKIMSEFSEVRTNLSVEKSLSL